MNIPIPVLVYAISCGGVLGMNLAESHTRRDFIWSVITAPIWPVALAWMAVRYFFQGSSLQLFTRYHRIVSEVASGPIFYWKGIAYRRWGIGIIKKEPRKPKAQRSG